MITATPFAIIPEWLLDAEIHPRAVVLYGILRRHADRDGHCHPSRRRLAERLRCSIDHLDTLVRQLVKIGAVGVTVRLGEDGRQTTNDYVLADAPPGAVTERPPRRQPAPRGGRWLAAPSTSYLNESQEERDSSAATQRSLNEIDMYFVENPTVLSRLRAFGAPDALVEPDLLRWLDQITEGTGVFWDAQMRLYLAWLESKSPSRRHKNLRRGFCAWIEEAIRKDLRREANGAQNGRVYNPR